MSIRGREGTPHTHHIDDIAAATAVREALAGATVQEGLPSHPDIGRAPLLCDLEAVLDHGQRGMQVAGPAAVRKIIASFPKSDIKRI